MMQEEGKLPPFQRVEGAMMGLSIISLAVGLSAGEPVIFTDEQPTLRVQLAGYDLSKPDDQRRLHEKLLGAADKVCKAAIPDAIQNELFACTRNTLARADHQLQAIVAAGSSGQPLVAAIEVTAGNK
jgi:UrcA family protein